MKRIDQVNSTGDIQSHRSVTVVLSKIFDCIPGSARRPDGPLAKKKRRNERYVTSSKGGFCLNFACFSCAAGVFRDELALLFSVSKDTTAI
jgi:hypothetical protein